MARARTKKKAKKGQRGGARPGAGRPRKVLVLDDFSDVGDPPADPLAQNQWAQRILALDLRRIVSGRADKALSQEIRSTARAIAALMPLERVYEAEKIIKGDRDAVRRGAKGAELQRADELSTPVSRRLS